jgi:hypothetical protein
MQNKLIAVVMMILLSGCSLMKTKPETSVTILPTYGDMVAIPKAQPTNLKPVQWQLLTRPELQKLLDDKSKPIVLYSLDETNMQTLTGNLDDMNRYLQEQKAVIDYTTGLINLRRETVAKDQQK